MFKLNNQEINFSFGNSKPKIMLNNIQVYPSQNKTIKVFIKCKHTRSVYVSYTLDRNIYTDDGYESDYTFLYDSYDLPHQFGSWIDTEIGDIEYEDFIGFFLNTNCGDGSQSESFYLSNLRVNGVVIPYKFVEISHADCYHSFCLPDYLPFSSELHIEVIPESY